MKCKLLFFICFIMLFLFSEAAYACTSFAVYSNPVFYGMNFDFMNLPIKFLISANGDMRTFHLAFERVIGEMKFFVNTAGMNSKGLFSSCQELQPESVKTYEKTDKNIFTFELYEAIASSQSVAEIKRIGQQFPLIDMPGITLHSLFADISGHAVVAEAGDPDTAFIEKKGDFMVMTNFSNRSMVGKAYKKAQGTGADRYIICHEFLQQHAAGFNVDKGFQLLSMCCNKDPEYPTMCSLVFDPHKKEVYIVMERNFTKVLKLSIEKQTIESFKGFDEKIVIPVPAGSQGVLMSDLQQQF